MLEDEYNRTVGAAPPHLKKAEELGMSFHDLLARVQFKAHQCSMIGVWGSRSQGGELFTGRNLDWTHDSGINKYKMITVYHPPGK